MHSIKSQARRSAWYADCRECDSRTYNPFARVTRRSINAATVSKEKEEKQKLEGGKVYLEETGAKEPETFARSNITGREDPADDYDTHLKDTPQPQTTLTHVSGIENVQCPPLDSQVLLTEIGSTKRTWNDIVLGPGNHTSLNDKINAYIAAELSKRAKVLAFPKLGWNNRDTRQHNASQSKAALGSWINLLLLFVPIGVSLAYMPVHPVLVFVVNFIAIIPLAAFLSFLTEELAHRVGEALGWAFHAFFGGTIGLSTKSTNHWGLLGKWLVLGTILEIVLSLTRNYALSREDVVLSRDIHTSPSRSVLPGNNTVATNYITGTSISRTCAVLLLLAYASYLLFQLQRHTSWYDVSRGLASMAGTKTSSEKKPTVNVITGLARSSTASDIRAAAGSVDHCDLEQDNCEDEALTFSVSGALVVLVTVTIIIAISGEYMVSVVNIVTNPASRRFDSLVLVPIIGSAAEHATAIGVATKDKLDSMIGNAIGTGLQILPVVVLLFGLGSKHRSKSNLSRFLQCWGTINLAGGVPMVVAADTSNAAALHWHTTLSSVCWISGAVIIGLALSYSIVQSLTPEGATTKVRIGVFSGWLVSCGVFLPATLARLRLLGPVTLLVTAILVMTGPCIIALAEDSARASDAILAFGTCAIFITLLAGHVLRQFAVWFSPRLHRVIVALTGPSGEHQA